MSGEPVLRRVRGFTFVELLMTLAIMAILAMVALPTAQHALQRQREQDLRLALMQIRTAIDDYKRAADRGFIRVTVGETGYPKRLEDLVEGVPDARSPTRRMLYFLRALPRDPFHADPAVPAAQTWATRSYSSPPDAPEPGEDVFDVFSQAGGVGLNGIPYRQW